MGHWANSEQHERKWHLLFISQLCRAQQCVWLGLLLCVKRVACFPWGEYQLISSDTEEKLPENTLLWGPTKHCGFLTIFQYGGVLPRLIAWLAHLLYHMYSLRSAFGLELEWRENKGIGPTTEQSRSCGEKSIWQILWLGSKSLFILSCHRCLITRILQDRKKKSQESSRVIALFSDNIVLLQEEVCFLRASLISGLVRWSIYHLYAQEEEFSSLYSGVWLCLPNVGTCLAVEVIQVRSIR